MKFDAFQEIRERILQSQNILLATHLKPDGDAIGSILGLADFLKSLNKKITVMMGDRKFRTI